MSRRRARAVTVAVAAVAIGCAGTHREGQTVVDDLDIEGNHALSDRKIERHIVTTAPGWWPFAKKHAFDPVVWDTDLRRIVRLYQQRGYYDAEVAHEQVTPAPPDGVKLSLRIEEGEATRVGSLDVRGLDDLPEREELVADLPLGVGDVLTESGWGALKGALRERLRARGHAAAQVEGEARIDVGARRAALELFVDPGGVYRFGDVRVDTGGGTAIRPEWIRERVRLAAPEGETFSDEAVTEARRRVASMGVFGAVAVEPGEPDPATGSIPIRVTTQEAPFHTLRLGGGARVDQIRNEGRLIAEWTNRNFLGGMRRLTAHGEAGWAFIPNAYAVARRDRALGARNGPVARGRLELEQPRFLGKPTLRGLAKLEVSRTLEQTYDQAGGMLTTGVSWQPRDSITIFPAYHLEGQYLRGPADAAVLTAPLTLGCESTDNTCFVWLSYVEEILTWDRRDDPLEPREGFYAALSLQQGGGPLLGDFDYLRFLPDVRGYFSLGEDDELTVAARLRVGALVTPSGNPDDSAVVTRFYSGGAFSMRGFNERRLSPLLLSAPPPSPGNPDPPTLTLPIGGNGLIDGSVELRYAVTSNLVLAAFLDFGRVTRDGLVPGDFGRMLFAVGAGVRYRTGIGPIRLDFARRLKVGTPPPLLVVDAAGAITEQSYAVDDSCLGLGGSGVITPVTDNLCVIHISIGEAF